MIMKIKVCKGEHEKSFYCHVYRNGNSNVVLGKTTLYSTFQWEFIVRNMNNL